MTDNLLTNIGKCVLLQKMLEYLTDFHSNMSRCVQLTINFDLVMNTYSYREVWSAQNWDSFIVVENAENVSIWWRHHDHNDSWFSVTKYT